MAEGLLCNCVPSVSYDEEVETRRVILGEVKVRGKVTCLAAVALLFGLEFVEKSHGG